MSGVFCDKEHVEHLKKSIDLVGPLQPLVIDDKTGEILLGKHRKNTGHEFPEMKKAVKGPLHRELIIVHGNFQRQPKEEETRYHIVRIARMLEEQGLPEQFKQVLNPLNDSATARMLDGKIPKERICSVVSSLVPYDETYVRRLLPQEYKMVSKARETSGQVCETSTAKTSLADAPGHASELGSSLTALVQDKEPSFPFKDCRCPECLNKTKCYG